MFRLVLRTLVTWLCVGVCMFVCVCVGVLVGAGGLALYADHVMLALVPWFVSAFGKDLCSWM